MRRRVLGTLIVLVLLGAVPGIGAPSLGAAQSDERERFESDLFGLEISWDSTWETASIEDDAGFVWIYLIQNSGNKELMMWAMPAFGGNEDVCIANSEFRLLADERNSDVEPADAPSNGPIEGGESAGFEFDFEPEGGRTTAWSLAAWCLELQAGYSVLQIELSAPAKDFDSALEALDGIEIQTTDGLPAPEFPMAEDQADLTSFWSQQFDAWELDPYVAPSHVSFSSRQMTACGAANPLDVGWFYCTADNAIFMDVAAAADLDARFGGGINRFVLAHETGHHVGTLLGFVPCYLSECLDKTGDVQFELMADCFAGAWMANASERGVLSERDIEDILVGIADSFSDPGHGSSAMRLWWVLQGFHEGVAVCFEPETNQ